MLPRVFLWLPADRFLERAIHLRRWGVVPEHLQIVAVVQRVIGHAPTRLGPINSNVTWS